MEHENLNKGNTANSDLGADMHWVAVEKGLPEDVRRVLAIMSSGLVSACYRWKGEWYMNDKGDMVQEWGYTVTHWMPLPQPPYA